MTSINRFWEIDTLRGTAIIMMIVFHITYDLNYFDIYTINLQSTGFLFLMYSIGIIFLLLVGVSLSLSYSRAENKLTEKQLRIKFTLRGLKIFGLGFAVTIATWIYPHDGFVIFGVLHCIGLSVILAYPFLHHCMYSLPVGILLVSAGMFLKTLTFNFNWLLWLGFLPSHFYTIDYYPLLPWFGIVLIGISIGKTVYPGYKRRFYLKDLSRFKPIRFFCFLGRHSLIIYCLHQPIIIALFYVFLL